MEQDDKGRRDENLAWFARRAALARKGAFDLILAKAGTEPPREGDELPEGWTDRAPGR